MICSLSIRTFFEMPSMVGQAAFITAQKFTVQFQKNQAGIKHFHNGPKCDLYMRKTLRNLFISEKFHIRKEFVFCIG